ncbi:MAG: Crp/Fnr family transcriptional regulator [Acidimicrobiia bacterium]|nr:Crp/Fnr family transcriptional regulator [Acidimicrobiia bacterium]
MNERRLLDTDLFASMPETVRAGLLVQATSRKYTRGDVLFRQGDPSGELFLLLHGRVAIASRSNDGRETVVAVLEDGGLIGELGLFDDAPRSAEARALTDTEVLAFPYEPVRLALRQQPEALWVVVRILAQRLRATDEALADAVFLDVPARTAKRLIDLAGDADEFLLPLTQEELAGLVGASRERVNKAIALFIRLGWIEVSGRNHYRILDRTALEDRSSQ